MIYWGGIQRAIWEKYKEEHTEALREEARDIERLAERGAHITFSEKDCKVFFGTERDTVEGIFSTKLARKLSVEKPILFYDGERIVKLSLPSD